MAGFLGRVASLLKELAVDERHFKKLSVFLLALEALLLALIIKMVSYTEIDWRAYMQEVEGVVNGTLDYSKLEGDTGPLVYPGGFVAVFLILYHVTGGGSNLLLAQCLYAVLYLLNLGVVVRIYGKLGGFPPYMLVFLGLTGYRLHSIYILRLFNDPVAMFFLYVAVLLFLEHRWYSGCFFFSLGVSVKMNVLLFAPGLLVVMVRAIGWRGASVGLLVCALVQLVLGAPFLFHQPVAYMAGAFNLGRQFLFEWTVNWRCVPEWVFLHRGFHFFLLFSHLTLLLLFSRKHWIRAGGFRSLLSWTPSQVSLLKPKELVWVIFTSNFVGMCVSRSLHYQFYVWYYHTLPFLLWSSSMPSIARVVVVMGVELAWNVFPSTVWSSTLLHVLHFAILTTLYQSGPQFQHRTGKDM